MAQYETDEGMMKLLGDDLENEFLGGDWIAMYGANSDISEYTFEGVHSVLNLAESPMLCQPNYETIGAAPEWMTENFQKGGKFKTEEIGHAHFDLGEIPIVSPTPSTASSFAFSEGEEQCEYLKLICSLGIDEKQLLKFSVKDLNRFLKAKGFSKEQQRCVKKRRRTLKNRGYAKNGRVKKINEKMSLESQNEDLLKEKEQLRAELESTNRPNLAL